MRGNTVLVIDDEPIVVKFAEMLLSRNGYKVLTGLGGEAGLKIFWENENVIDLIILDMNMPDLTGDEVLGKIRDKGNDVKVIIFSGFFEPDKKEVLKKLNVAGYLKKPCDNMIF